METSCNIMKIEMMFIWWTERLLSCVPVRDPSVFPSPLTTAISLLSADNVTRGTSEIDRNCRSSLGRHLQTILTRLFILLLILQLAICMSLSILCLFFYPLLFALFYCIQLMLQLGLVVTNTLMSASQLFITHLSTL